jgi:hypothetical protein
MDHILTTQERWLLRLGTSLGWVACSSAATGLISFALMLWACAHTVPLDRSLEVPPLLQMRGHHSMRKRRCRLRGNRLLRGARNDR